MEVREVSFSYDDAHDLIHQFSLVVGTKHRIAIVGRNGYGKSTLLRLLAGELTPKRGSVRTTEKVKIGYFGQTGIQRLHGEKTVEEEIASANPELSSTEVKNLCGQMMFPGVAAEKSISVLSGGEKSRVLLGKILASPCNMLLLDEPTHHLDVESVDALIDAVEQFQGAVVLVTHSELILRRLSWDYLVVFHEGQQELFCGGYEEFLEKIGWQEEKASKAVVSPRSDDRRKRAEHVAARSKILKPFREEITRLESSIMDLEAEEEKQRKLLEQGGDVAVLCKNIGVLRKQINELFDRLMEVNDRHEEEKRRFEEMTDCDE
jgi:ATP-binding cassette subfamily F protein 3